MNREWLLTCLWINRVMQLQWLEIDIETFSTILSILQWPTILNIQWSKIDKLSILTEPICICPDTFLKNKSFRVIRILIGLHARQIWHCVIFFCYLNVLFYNKFLTILQLENNIAERIQNLDSDILEAVI